MISHAFSVMSASFISRFHDIKKKLHVATDSCKLHIYSEKMFLVLHVECNENTSKVNHKAMYM